MRDYREREIIKERTTVRNEYGEPVKLALLQSQIDAGYIFNQSISLALIDKIVELELQIQRGD